MEERILEAVEYITISLDDIKDYQDFVKYKPELIKAINDIKNIVQRKIKLNENDTIENGEGEKTADSGGKKAPHGGGDHRGLPARRRQLAAAPASRMAGADAEEAIRHLHVLRPDPQLCVLSLGLRRRPLKGRRISGTGPLSPSPARCGEFRRNRRRLRRVGGGR